MAENETLDSRKPRGGRWRLLFESLLKGDLPENTARRAIRSLELTLRTLLSGGPQGEGPQVRLEDLFRALGGTWAQRQQAVLSCQNRDFAQLFSLVMDAPSPRAAAREWLSAILHRACDIFRNDFVGSSAAHTIQAFENSFHEMLREASPGLDNLAEQLATNPGSPPKVALAALPEMVQDPKKVLRISLLGGGRS